MQRSETRAGGGLRDILVLTAFGATVYALGHVAVVLAPEGSDVAAWWPAAGVSVLMCLWYHHRRWAIALAVVLFSSLANIAGGRDVVVAVGFGISNAAEALVATWWVHRAARTRPMLRAVSDAVRLGTAALLGALAIGAGAALTVALFGHGDAYQTFLNVIPSHLAAVLLIVPIGMSPRAAIPRSVVEWSTNWAAVGIVSLVVFGSERFESLAFLVFAPLVWSGLRLGVRVVALQLVAVGVAVTLVTAAGSGPFARTDAAVSASLVQVFVLVGAAMILPLALAMSERERAVARAEASSQLFRRGFEEALVGMLLVRVDGENLAVLEANAVAENKLDVLPDRLVPTELRDDDLRSLGEIAASISPGRGWRGEMSRATSSGEMRRYNVSLAHLSGKGASAVAACQVIDITERHRAEVALERQARRDHLTGLPNRIMFDERLRTELEESARTGIALSVIFFDIDNFKLINDGFGHRVGDQVLVELGRRIASAIRPGDLVARMGGDEFAIVCPRTGTDAHVARAVAERIRAVAGEPVVLDELSYRIAVSIGVTSSDRSTTAANLLNQADIALYSAKAAGKNTIRLFSRELGVATESRVRIEADLLSALDRDQLEIHMQPVVDISTGRIRSAEALARWRHPTQGMVPPDVFIGIAERIGMMPRLGAWVLDEACRQAASWPGRDGHPPPTVHVNVSARQLDSPGFARQVVETLERHDLAPDRVVIELTETYLADIESFLVAELEDLSRRGIRLAADDFGTGYSPLTRLTELPVKVIKIDKAFVDRIEVDGRSEAIVASLVSLCRTLDLEVVGEGVETAGQAAKLAAFGCELGQGYLWSPALPEIEFCELLNGSGHLDPVAAY